MLAWQPFDGRTSDSPCVYARPHERRGAYGFQRLARTRITGPSKAKTNLRLLGKQFRLGRENYRNDASPERVATLDDGGYRVATLALCSPTAEFGILRSGSTQNRGYDWSITTISIGVKLSRG